MGGDSRQVGGDFLAKPLDPEGPPPAPTTLKLHDAVYSRRNKDDRSKPRVFIGSYNLYPCQTKTSGRKIVRPIPHLHL